MPSKRHWHKHVHKDAHISLHICLVTAVIRLQIRPSTNHRLQSDCGLWLTAPKPRPHGVHKPASWSGASRSLTSIVSKPELIPDGGTGEKSYGGDGGKPAEGGGEHPAARSSQCRQVRWVKIKCLLTEPFQAFMLIRYKYPLCFSSRIFSSFLVF